MDHNFSQCPPAVQKQNLCSIFNAIVKDKICKIWLLHPKKIVPHMTPIKPQCAVFAQIKQITYNMVY